MHFAHFTSVIGSTSCPSFQQVLKGTPYNPLISDVWSMGVVLFVMVCGTLPFEDADHVKMVRAQLEKNFDFNPDRKTMV